MTDPSPPKPPPAAAASTPDRRAHLAVVDPAAGAAGTPTPSERQGYLIAQLRKGEPARGWVVALAKRWGLSHSALSEEIAAARALLEQSRSPEAAAVLAHELIVQAVELGEKVQKLASAPPSNPTTEAALTRRLKGLSVAATLKLKAAATLRQVHSLGESGGRFGGGKFARFGHLPPPPPLTNAALRGESPLAGMRDAPAEPYVPFWRKPKPTENDPPKAG